MRGDRWTPRIWGDAGFLEDLRAWVAGHLGGVRGMRRLRVRPWASVWSVDAERGRFFVKQNCPGQRHEAGLVDALSRIDGARLVTPVAVDADRDLLLTAYRGLTLRESARRVDLDTWVLLVREAMLLARATVGRTEELGLTAIAPRTAGAYAERALREWEVPSGMRRRAERAVLQAAEDGAALAALGLPLTLNHNDLHDANAFASGGRVTFFDFGDAVASSPLCALRVPLDACADAWGTTSSDRRVRRVRDAALEVWSDIAPVAELRAAMPRARRLAALARAESWHRVLESVPASDVGADRRHADAAWLAEAAGDRFR